MYTLEKIKQNITELAAMNESQWDAICAGCGVCCLHKIDVDGVVYFSKYACTHCDLKNKSCKRYNDRLTGDNCAKIKLYDVIAGKYLPDNCAYVREIFGPTTNIPDINWNEIKQNPIGVGKIKKSIFKDSNTWAARTDDKIISELLEFIEKI